MFEIEKKKKIGLRILMENTVHELNHGAKDISVGRCNDNIMVPCFISSAGTGNKKRKLLNKYISILVSSNGCK